MHKSFENTEYFTNRELSWLEFNHRVLMEAVNPNNPVFEQMKFLSITCSNLDEFFMIRVASVRDQLRAGYEKKDDSGLTPKEQLKKISSRAHKMMKNICEVYKDHILPELNKNGIRILKPADLSQKQQEFLKKYFMDEVYPVLTPMAADMSRPFPLLLNKSLNIAVLIKDNDEKLFATVKVPTVLKRMIELPSKPDKRDFILLEDVIIDNIQSIFNGLEITAVAPYRITRNADLSIDEEEAADLLQEIKKSLRMRKWGSVIRLEIMENPHPYLLKVLKKSLEVTEDEIYYADSPINFDFLMKQLYDIDGFDNLRYEPYTPNYPKWIKDSDNIFDLIKRRDFLLHHPYDSFYPVLRLLEEAAKDPNVLAIKQTLYRVSGNSPVVKALSKAAEAGKQVTVLLEVKARFDEENNINWGSKLEKAGCHVIYGLHGLKTHSKITLVVRREEDGVKRYLHLGTGNYNDVTAKIYTDFSLFTAEEKICNDATAFFNTLTGYSVPPKMEKLISAPVMLRSEFERLIKREIENAKKGKKAEIFAKMNSLVDQGMIKLFYEASSVGVKIRLIVRGICCLKTGIKGVSDNIEVHSIVGRFLEHSRVYEFENDGNREVYLSSADMMPRNLNRRVELLFPVENKEIADNIMNIMELYWSDNCQTSILNGYKYTKRETGEIAVNAQQELIVR